MPSDVRTSRFLSLVLRHRPQAIGLALDAGGWARVDELLAALAAHGRPLAREELERIVAENPKRRFALSEDGERIRASQGHSIAVDLGLEPREPPELLYHGTARASLESIRAAGLRRGRRQHVHLSRDAATARSVGARHGAPVVIEVEAGRMHRDGLALYLSANGVWLTAEVPPEYLRFPAR
jgi:putative RNA 2'-phosphotransferase